MPVIRVALEIGSRRTFASALDWAGWCRAAKGQKEAIQALVDYAGRYARVAAGADVRFAPKPWDFRVIEHLDGDATTEFGAPGVPAKLESEPMTKAEVDRMCTLVQACWVELDKIVKRAQPSLRKGPRGGGRDRDKIVDHVLAAEGAYGSKLGLKLRQPSIDDRKGVAAHRKTILDALGASGDGRPLREGGWTARYAARRIAWHATDHAWEIEDRTEP